MAHERWVITQESSKFKFLSLADGNMGFHICLQDIKWTFQISFFKAITLSENEHK